MRENWGLNIYNQIMMKSIEKSYFFY